MAFISGTASIGQVGDANFFHDWKIDKVVSHVQNLISGDTCFFDKVVEALHFLKGIQINVLDSQFLVYRSFTRCVFAPVMMAI